MGLTAMRIIPYNGEENLEDIESLSVIIKAVPFENSFVPAFFIQSPEEDYPMSLDELNCLMDGVEIAHKSIDHIIAFLLQQSFDRQDRGIKDEDGEF
jgi:hypothetical protein